MSNSDVYTLTYAEDQYYYDGAEIHNGKAYIDAGDEDFKLIVDRKTIFVDVNGEVAYTGYDEVPNVSWTATTTRRRMARSPRSSSSWTARSMTTTPPISSWPTQTASPATMTMTTTTGSMRTPMWTARSRACS